MVLWLQSFHLQFQVLRAHAMSMLTGWTTLRQHRMPQAWLAGAELHNIFAGLQQRARKMGGVLPLEHPLEVFDVPTSFTVIDRTIVVFTHIPVVKEKQNLFEFMPIPIKKGEKHVLIKPRKELLLVAADNRVHKELNEMEVQQKCQTIGAYLICQSIGPMLRRMEDSCLGSLFDNRLDKIEEKCPVEDFGGEWAAVHVSAETLVMFTKEEQSLTTSCRNGTKVNYKVQGLKEVSNPKGCITFTDRMEMEAIPETTVQFNVMHEVTWQLQTWDLDEHKEMRDILATIKDIGNHTKVEDGETLKTLIQETRERGEQWGWISTSVGLVLTVSVVVILGCLAARYRCLKSQGQAAVANAE